MAAPLIDFTHLTPDQRIELAEQLWDSLDPVLVVPSLGDADILRARRAELEKDGDLGAPWHQAMQELKMRGA